MHHDVHDRLQENQAGAQLGFAETLHGRDFEGLGRAVHFMGFAVGQRGFNVDNREAVLGALDAGLSVPLFNGRNVLLGHRAAVDFIDEVKTVRVRLLLVFFLKGRFHVNDGVLAAAARLLDIAVFELHGLRQRLAIGHHRLADSDGNAVIAQQFVDGYFQVQLTHAAQDQLARLRIDAGMQGRIVAHHFAECVSQLGLIDVLGRQESLGNDRLGEADLFQENRLVLVA